MNANYTQKYYQPSTPQPDQELPNLKAQNLKEMQTNFLLDKLQEESAEVIQAISKIRRFGKDNQHPDRNTTNYQELIQELEDFLAIVAGLEACKYLDLTKSQQTIYNKMQNLVQ
jgi:NTP pyrophosphatase (non-canonical NTP hydrolase)